MVAGMRTYDVLSIRVFLYFWESPLSYLNNVSGITICATRKCFKHCPECNFYSAAVGPALSSNAVCSKCSYVLVVGGGPIANYKFVSLLKPS